MKGPLSWLKTSKKPYGSDEILFDAHCHIFNLEYLFLEAGQMLVDWLAGDYPEAAAVLEKKTAGFTRDEEQLNIKEEIELFFRWLFEILDSAFDSELDNACFMEKTAKKVWGVNRLRMTPLMMDIYFMFSEALHAEDTEYARWNPWKFLVRKGKKSHPDFSKEVQSLWEAKTGGRKKSGLIGDSGELFAERVIAHIEKKEKEHPIPGFENVDLSAGFHQQLQAILETAQTMKGQLFPFLAVDPRREGIVDAVLNNNIVSNSGPFYGVKLYPRLGVHPLCKELKPVYGFCEDNNIPITTHCSYKGFPDSKMTWAKFGNPKHYRLIFKKFPKLRINLAHFGDRTDNQPWAEEIADIMQTFPNAYSDLSCFTHEASLDHFIQKFGSIPEVRSRTMFGSDFDVMYFTNPGDITMKRYYRMFLDKFGAERLKEMAGATPLKFLDATSR